MLEKAAPDITALSSCPTEHWRQISSTNPLERLNKEINRRTRVMGIIPDRSSIIRLIGAVLAEQHNEWQVACRYISQESLAKAMESPAVSGEIEEEMVPLLMAS